MPKERYARQNPRSQVDGYSRSSHPPVDALVALRTPIRHGTQSLIAIVCVQACMAPDPARRSASAHHPGSGWPTRVALSHAPSDAVYGTHLEREVDIDT